MARFFILFASLGLIGGFASANEQLLQDCMQCHGDNGVSVESDVPTIAGASAYYLEESMLAYQADARACPPSAYRSGDTSRPERSMCEIAKAMSEAQIQESAAYFADQPFVPAKQAFKPALAERGGKLHKQQCDRCHAEAGSLADDDAGILAGQWIEAQRFAIKDMLDGTRPTSKKMLDKLQALSADDIEALLHFYAAQQ